MWWKGTEQAWQTARRASPDDQTRRDEGLQMPDGSDPRLISRRTVLAGGASLAGAGLLASACSSSSSHHHQASPKPGSDLGAVKHVVFLMQENRSFDHYFGTYRGVSGFDDRPKDGVGNFAQAWPGGPNGQDTLLPFNLASATAQLCSGNASIPTHDWEPQHLSWARGSNAAFLKTHALSGNDGPEFAPLVMGYFTRKQLDFYYALADRYTICDRYFCSVLGPTMPNRIMYMSGMLDPSGSHGGPVLKTPGISTAKDAVASVEWDTLPEALEDKGVSWKIYQPPSTSVGPNLPTALATGFNVMLFFKQFVNQPKSPLYQKAFLPSWPDNFEQDIKAGTLPSVSWVLPPIAYSEHPNGSPAAGQYFVHRVLTALQANADVWSKTVVVLCYDENGGFFDHIVPPTAPAGTPDEYITTSPLPADSGGTAGPIGLGFRVPAMVISPFSAGGYVDSTVLDHTSAALFLEQRFGIVAPNISAWRRKTVGDLTSTLGFSKPVTSGAQLPDTPLDLPAGCPTLTNLVPFLTAPEPLNLPTAQSMPAQEPGKARRRT
jgi:phospholipase C